MRRDPMGWLPVLVALVVLTVLGLRTLEALRVTGAFGTGGHRAPTVLAPAYRTLADRLEHRAPSGPAAPGRDPFMFGTKTNDNPVSAPAPAAVRPARPTPPPQPVLTAILYDNDPRALIHWQDRDWTVREGGLFDDFQVVAITREQVTLRHGETTLVLQRRQPGE